MTDEPQMEIGVECSCGFKRRATKTADGGERWNGHEIEALHWFQIDRERWTSTDVLPTHRSSSGLFATMDWPALTPEEQTIGEAWMAGMAEGARSARAEMKKRLDAVVVTEFGS